MLIEGVFEKFPGLKVVLVEGGVAWLPALMWRLDTQYERFRSEVPWLTKKPSEYIKEHVRLTSQPIERPDNDKHLLKMLELMDAQHILMFSSDYPHWDFDSPKHSFPKMPQWMRKRIFFENARELYRL
jgi:predicted TIM-barrel fold metal-dependent hydrolase